MFLSSFFTHNWEDALRPDWASDIEKYRTAFEVFGMPIYWYSIMILLAVVLSVVIGYFGFAKRLGATSDHLFEGVVVGVIAGITGGRLWYVIADVLGGGKSFVQPTIIETIKAILNLRDGGLAISGAVILAGLGVFAFCKFRKIKVLYILEIVMPLIMLSQVLGRWGNFFNFEAHGGLINVPGLNEAIETGKLSNEVLQAQRDFLWFLPDFIIDRMYITQHVSIAGYYHPCFFYEGVANFIGFTTYMILRRVIKKGIYVGDGIGFYLIWYGIVRFFIESMRTDAQMIGDNIPVVMVYTPIMVILGITWLVVRRVKKIQLITCYEALYGYNSTVLYSQEETNIKKNKKQKNKQKQQVKMEEDVNNAEE